MIETIFLEPARGWQAAYLGVPYREHGDTPDGWDCWGLVAYCLATHFGVTVPRFDAVRSSLNNKGRSDRMAAIAPAFEEGRRGWRRITLPRPGAAVLFNISGRPLHVGLCLGQGAFLHVDRSVETCVERLSAPTWSNRVEGFYVPQ